MKRIHLISLTCVCLGLSSAQAPVPSPLAAVPGNPGQAPASPSGSLAQPANIGEYVDEHFELSLLEGLARVEELSAAEDYEGAVHIGNSLLTLRSFDVVRGQLGLEQDSWWNPVLDQLEPLAEYLKLSLTREEKAHVNYTLGVVAVAQENAADAKHKFETATAKAGPGSLREAASYNTSTLALLAGEAWRAQMPEFGGQPPAPAPAAPGAAPGDEEEAPDPLEEARAAYLAAKDGYILRLRIDWKDSDTRANMQLVMRRLHELDEIERQREEQEKQQEEQDDENKDEESEDSESDEDKKEKQDPSEDQQEGDPDKDQEDSPPDESEQPEEPEEPEEPAEEEQEQPDPSDEESEGEQQEQPEEQPGEPQQEVYLTKEEVQRLLDRLKEHEEQGQKLRERKRQSRRPTARDW